MMDVDNKLIKHVAKVARLEYEDVKKFTSDLKEIIQAFSKLDEVDTKSTKSSFHPVELKNELRKDKAGSCLSQQEALTNTKHKKDGYFLGPRAV